jgi:endonuclease/exonuclease/phosphatase family metal-dependent hydrolase
MKEVRLSYERKLDRISKAPLWVKPIFLVGVLFIMSYSLHAQNLSSLSFGTDSTFEVMTWNIQEFPKRGQSTADSVKKILKSLDVDVYALQEITDTSEFGDMAREMSDYDYYVQEGEYGVLAYIYKKEIEISELYEIYTSRDRPFPRAPVVMKMKFKENDYVIFNNHFKCCGDGVVDSLDSWDEEKRRLDASDLIKDYIDQTLSEKQVMVVGDLNDELTDVDSNNVFQPFLDDPANYKFADMSIAEGSVTQFSFPDYDPPSHLDHILITNELFEEFEQESTEIKTIRIDDYYSGGFDSYDRNVSDHRPVALKFHPASVSTDIMSASRTEWKFSNYPNPFEDKTTFSFNPLNVDASIEIYNMTGQRVSTIEIPSGSSSATWNVQSYPKGLYLAKFKTQNVTRAITKLMVLE